MTRLVLRAQVRIGVDYDDRTRFGSPVTDRPDRGVREVFGDLLRFAAEHGDAAMLRAAPGLLAGVIAGDIFHHITEPDGAGAWRVKPEVLFPDPAAAPPVAISFVCDETQRHVRARLPASHWPLLHDLVAALSADGCDPANPRLHPDLRATLDALQREDLVEEATPTPALGAEADLTFIGHNTVVVRSRTASVIVDPFLFAADPAYPADYQPLQLRDVGPVDAVLITHSHPDHFDPASLLRFPAETRVIVPRVERETILSVAMERRLRELGFSNVQTLDWGQAALAGDIEVHALPFYGEQPTDCDVLHPAIRNAGNTYLVRTPTHAAVFLADSGRDGQGDVRDLALRTRERLGPVDVVFSGYRGWLTYPAQLLCSSVARFMLFVPPRLWSVRQQIMTTASEAVDIAERWGARYLVPYADGGAPWHWRIGLGPNLAAETGAESAVFDPLPERVLDALATRSEDSDGLPLASPIAPLLLRPGDSVGDLAGEAAVLRLPGHAWPYAAMLAVG